MQSIFPILCLGRCLSTLDAGVMANKGSRADTVDPNGCVDREQKSTVLWIFNNFD
ncbi:hypothetical protein [Chlamydia abortus]|uniref:hypothetical protein n=1 Tax=Chlamydia abortus TaxID=83555 RepID=UPI0015586016|nr:hypothetical protein [Chlamydia abortus]